MKPLEAFLVVGGIVAVPIVVGLAFYFAVACRSISRIVGHKDADSARCVYCGLSKGQSQSPMCTECYRGFVDEGEEVVR